jgi:hypothetical protein
MATLTLFYDGKSFVAKEPVDLPPNSEVTVDVIASNPVGEPVKSLRYPKRKFGMGKGTVLYMSPDFDKPLEDFKDYM